MLFVCLVLLGIMTERNKLLINVGDYKGDFEICAIVANWRSLKMYEGQAEFIMIHFFHYLKAPNQPSFGIPSH